jgi:hypothetical protein
MRVMCLCVTLTLEFRPTSPITRGTSVRREIRDDRDHRLGLTARMTALPGNREGGPAMTATTGWA